MTLRLGIVGTGQMAAAYAQTAAATPGVTLAGVVSRDPARARAFAGVHGAGAGGDDIQALLGQVDALYVATDPDRHSATVQAALKAGCPVLVEKPLTTDPDQTQALFDLAARHNTLLVEAIWTLTLPAYGALRARARDARLLTFDFSNRVQADALPKLFDPGTGGVLLDRAVYGVAAALDLLGPVRGQDSDIQRNAEGIDTSAMLRLTHEGGAASLITLSLDWQGSNRLDLACEGGNLSLGPSSLMPEVLTMTPAWPAQIGDPMAQAGLMDRLRQRPMLRRLKRALAARRGQTHSYGGHRYGPMLAHLCDLVAAGAQHSDLIPPALSCQTARIVHRAGQD